MAGEIHFTENLLDESGCYLLLFKMFWMGCPKPNTLWTAVCMSSVTAYEYLHQWAGSHHFLCNTYICIPYECNPQFLSIGSCQLIHIWCSYLNLSVSRYLNVEEPLRENSFIVLMCFWFSPRLKDKILVKKSCSFRTRRGIENLLQRGILKDFSFTVALGLAG